MAKINPRVQEFLRRSKVFFRGQLELLQAEGVLSLEDFNILIECHPLTVSKEKIEINLPKRNPDYEPQRITFTEVCFGLISRVSNQMIDFNKVSEKLDPMGLGYLTREDFGNFRKDLIAAVLMIRNLSLTSCFDQPTSASLKKSCIRHLSLYLGEEYTLAYNLFHNTWLEAIVQLEMPQIILSRLLLKRIEDRLQTSRIVDPMFEDSISELLVITEWYYWHMIKMTAILIED